MKKENVDTFPFNLNARSQRTLLIILAFIFTYLPSLSAQNITGHIYDQANNSPLAYVKVVLNDNQQAVLSDREGYFEFNKELEAGSYMLKIAQAGYDEYKAEVEVEDGDIKLKIPLQNVSYEMTEVLIADARNAGFDTDHLKDVEGVGIYAAKKTELIKIDDIRANLATNNARQIYSKVAGLNIWESDGAGLQLGIGGRGLSPNRTANFNTRQNGYDISADALGYPESYYTPPTEAVERIEIVRGAASLQYGTQFGGVLNFRLKQGAKDKPIQWTSRQTIGSFGFYNSFNSAGGTLGKVSYYGYHQYKRGNGWRPHSGFESQSAYGTINWQANNRLKLGLEYTWMNYLAQQAGGLTDREFEVNPRQSSRERNWFQVNWNLAAFHLDYQFTSRTMLNIRNFGLIANRKALGYRGPTSSADPIINPNGPEYTKERDLLWGDFRNFGNETRFIHGYDWKELPQTFLVGLRYYQGFNESRQGNGSSGYNADFRFLREENLEQSAYIYPSKNFSAFAEHIFRPLPKWSIIPGARYEYINTTADGFYRTTLRDLADNIYFDSTYHESRESKRDLFLLGLGVSYRVHEQLETYFNISQNYRAINFTDFRTANPSFRVDPDMQDERGFNADLGFRGQVKDWLSYDLSIFYLAYKDRIGVIQQVDSTLFSVYRYRTNIADSRTFGIESFAEVNISRLLGNNSWGEFSLFSNLAWIDSKYMNAKSSAVEGNQVEMVPTINFKSGAKYTLDHFSVSFQYTYITEHFTDATNAVKTSSAIVGTIPTYYVMDASISYKWKYLTLEGNVNNLSNHLYFTRRATGYPGPGIIPAEGRSFFLSVQIKL